MVNNNRLQSGSAHLIIIVMLSMALLGSLGFVFYQNFIQNKDTVITDTPKTNEQAPSQLQVTTVSKTPIVEPSVIVSDFLTLYLLFKSTVGQDTSDSAFVAQSTALTDEYKNSIINPSGMVYFSPVILAQNIPSNFEIGDATTTNTNSNVPVTLNFGDTPHNIVYSLILVNNEWKIDGVVKA